MKTRRHHPGSQGFTLIELLIAVAVIAVILVIAAPSFRDMIQMQRLRSITAQLVTDLQFARNEAVSRGTLLRLSFRSDASASMTCYTLYTSSVNNNRCDCRLGAVAACVNGNVEVRTVQVPLSLGVQVVRAPFPPGGVELAFAFDNVTGGLYKIPFDSDAEPLDDVKIESFIDDARKLVVRINLAGRTLVCSPAGSTMTETACLP